MIERDNAGAARRWDVLAFGDPCVDVVLGVEKPPLLGDKVLGRPLGTWAGGTTSNVACAVSRLGLRSAVFGRTGNDAYGGLMWDSFARFGVDTAYLRAEAGAASATAFIMVADSGEKSVVYMPMEHAALDEDSLEAAVRQARVVYAMPYDLDALDLVSRFARRHGTLVAIDIEAAVAPDVHAMRERLKRADIVFFNESGFVAGTGKTPGKEAMESLLAHGPRIVVVTLGEAGVMAVDRHGYAEHPAFPVHVVDTTGAGDAFNGAFLVSTLEGKALGQSLRFACAAASCAVAAMGARAGLCGRMAVDAIADAGMEKNALIELAVS